MYQQEIKGNQQAALSGKLTKSGKIRSRYTLKCEFNDGNTFTYRSDNCLAHYHQKGYKSISELDALVLRFNELRKLLFDAKLFDNSKPKPEDLIMHFSGSISQVLINHLPKRYSL